MIIKKRSSKTILMATLTLGLLSACAESDIAEIEQRELDIAERAEIARQVEENDTPDTGAAMSGVDLADYELVFSDEFNGTQLSPVKWNTVQQWGADFVINSEEQYYVDTQTNPDFGYNPFSFDGESLIISAINTPENLQSVANDQPYLSGAVTTAEKFDMTYGYIEARMQFPKGTALWPAFWMLSSDFVDLKPQLFIAEGDGGRPDSIFHNYNYHDADGNLRSPGQWQVKDETFTQGFHTVAVSWKEEELLFFIDGIPRYRIVGENVSKQPMYLIANLAVGGVWAGSPDAQTSFPADLKIDYIRAYRNTGM